MSKTLYPDARAMTSITATHVRWVFGDTYVDGQVMTKPNVGDFVEFASQPPWPDREEQTYVVTAVNHLFDLTRRSQVMSIEIAVAADPAVRKA